MPLPSPSSVSLDMMRPPLPAKLLAARAELMRRTAGAPAEFGVGEASDPGASAQAEGPATPESFRRFEAMVLQTFIQNMLPKDGAAFYGKGMAGDMWKSLLAEKVANVMAERGSTGIADRVLGERYTAPPQSTAQTDATNQAPATVTAHKDKPLVAPTVMDGMRRSLSEPLIGVESTSADTEVQSTMKRG